MTEAVFSKFLIQEEKPLQLLQKIVGKPHQTPKILFKSPKLIG